MESLLALQPVAKELALSRLHGHRSPSDVLFVLSVGNALGLNAATALMNIYNVNGMPSLKADLKLALAKRHPEYNGCEIDSNSDRCIVKMSRKGQHKEESITSTFTIQDAERAGLMKKDNWKNYPARMLKARAVSYAVNDLFPDIVFGLLSHEEAVDMLPEGTVDEKSVIEANYVEVTPEPQPQPVDAVIINPSPQDTQTSPTEQEIIDLKIAISGMLKSMVESNIDGFADETRRHNSFVNHGLGDTVKDCDDYAVLVAYHDHLAAKLRGDNAKPTIKQRQASLIEKLTSMSIMLEELQYWSEIVQTAKRHEQLDGVQDWITKVEAMSE